MPRRKNSEGNNGPKLVPQPHGGALLSGGVPGNRGGPGRPPNALRVTFRKLLDEEGIPAITEIIKDPDTRARDVIAAVALVARIALPRLIEATVREYVLTPEATLAAWEKRLDEDPELAASVEDLFQRLHEPADPIRIPPQDDT